MSTLDTDTLEEQLQQAHLLCVRRKFDEAETLLRKLDRRNPGHPEVRYMLARLASTKRAEKADGEKLREWRYTLGLQTSWQRLLWAVGGIAGAAYGGGGLAVRLAECLRGGFSAEITTQIYKGGRYTGHWVDWTRPVYYDVLYYAAVALVGVAALLVVRLVARGATQWEELDAPMPENSRFAGW